MKFSTVLTVASVSFASSLCAQTERDLDSHEHGSALLNVALDGNQIFLELESPWDNFVGFEHAPSTDEQQALVDNTLAKLNDPGTLFSFGGGDCVFETVMIENSIGEAHDDHDDEHKDEHAHDDHDDEHKDEHAHDDHSDEHKDEHAHDDHSDEHKDEHAHDDHSDEASIHSEVLASYIVNCENVSEVSYIDANLLNVWTGFEDLDVQMIGPGSQTSGELNPDQIRLDVTQVQ